MVPRTWRKPLTLIYDRNYKYGTSLYSDSIAEIERRYKQSMARTRTGFSADTLGRGVLNPAQVLPELRTPSHLQSVLLTRERRRPLPDIESHFVLPPGRRYRHLIADPFDLEEKARARRRLRKRQGDKSGHHVPLPSLHVPDFGTDSSFSNFLYPYWGKLYPFSHVSDFPFLSGKCLKLQNDLEMVSHRVSDAESKLRWEKVIDVSKSHQETRVVELEAELQAMGRDNSELYKVIKRQARQIEEMQSLQDELHRHLSQAHEDVVSWQRKFNDLQYERNTVRHSRIII